jgi:hypothetical protein
MERGASGEEWNVLKTSRLVEELGHVNRKFVEDVGKTLEETMGF